MFDGICSTNPMKKNSASIDCNPTYELNGFKYCRGQVLPFGATMVLNGVNFSVYSSAATSCTLVLFVKNEELPFAEIPFPKEFMIGNVFSMIVFNLDFKNLEYGYRMDGPYEPKNGHRFNKNTILTDPYAKAISGRDVWMSPPRWEKLYTFRSRFVFEDFDWEGDKPLENPIENLIIYEMHVRSFTQHPSSGVKFNGTFAGLKEKIPYLLDLGVNSVELMPVSEFDEYEHSKVHPKTGEMLVNYWGYSPISLFATKSGYAATGNNGMQVNEFKSLIKEFHKNGIEVLLDIVFNHTAEGNHRGPTISFKGIDNKTYYMLTPDGYYYNFSGAGNTLNCNHPVVRNMVLDCLRFWASEYHIDGFRFDLAAILGRSLDGMPIGNPTILELLAYDPVLAKCKLIADTWEAGSLYHLGSFPGYNRWAEWNVKYRNTIRRFLKGDLGVVGDLSQRILGSPDMYWSRGTTAGINFITCHNGFTLYDLVSYNQKHNEANGENNLDGTDENYSWNCGWEGDTDNAQVNELRKRQIKNALTILLVSQGTPMIQMGDEMGRTQKGNNNAYCHDNELNWLNWELKDINADLYAFARHMIHFRQKHAMLRNKNHLQNFSSFETGYPDISFHGIRPWQADWSHSSRVFAFMLDGRHAYNRKNPDDFIYVAMNMYWDALPFWLPQLPSPKTWHVSVNTSMSPPFDFHPFSKEPKIKDQQKIIVGGRSIIILTGK